MNQDLEDYTPSITDDLTIIEQEMNNITQMRDDYYHSLDGHEEFYFGHHWDSTPFETITDPDEIKEMIDSDTYIMGLNS